MPRPLIVLGPSTGPTPPAKGPRRGSRLATSALGLGILGVSLLGLGCTGSVGDAKGPGPGGGPGDPGGNGGPPMTPGGNGGPPGPADPGAPPGTLPSDDTTVPGTAPLRRLTRLEYVNTVRDLLGIGEVPAARLASFAADQESAASGFLRGGSVTAAPDARVLMLAAEELTALALPKVPMLLPCTPVPTANAEQDSCADKFLAGFGRRAYRRPLTDAELADLRALYRAQRAPDIGGNFQQAVASTIAAMLQSPYFLYRWELGTAAPTKDGNLVRFNQHEMASRLSYLFWASMPDDKLFEAADAGKLSTADQIAVEAQRLLADPKAKEALTDFHLQWLNMVGLADMPKDPSLTDYTPAVVQAMLRETKEFVSSVFQGPKADGKLETLFTSKSSFADGPLARIYGIKDLQGSAMQPVTFNSAERAGLFTQATFLTTKADAIDSHPIKRGDVMLNKVMCIHLELPGNIMVPPLPEPKPGQTTRERVSIHSDSACATCHKMIDPVGFAFENYDAIGRYRSMEEGKTVDASGSFPLGAGPVTFKNAVEMLPQIAKSKEVQDCMVTMWWRYALRRQELTTEDPSLKLVREAFRLSGFDMRQLLVAFTRTRAFSHRMPSPDEVLQ
jgi:hypothetical protein